MKTFFCVAAFVTLALGIGWLLFPSEMLTLWGATPDGVATYIGRRYGALMLGYTAILWHSRNASASPARGAILAGAALVTAMLAILSLIGALTAVVSPAVWIAVVIEGLLASGFLYYFVTTGVAPRDRDKPVRAR